MNQRKNIAEAKKFWFEGLMAVSGIVIEGQVYALPRIEATRALKYCLLIEACKTYEDVEKLCLVFEHDIARPKLIPTIRPWAQELERLEEMWTWEDGNQGRNNGQLSNSEIMSYWRQKEFSIWDSPLYRDESDTLRLVRDFQVWTDAWIPGEVCELIGTPDSGFGMDYVEAEFAYRDVAAFEWAFKSFGFSVDLDSPELRHIIRFV